MVFIFVVHMVLLYIIHINPRLGL